MISTLNEDDAISVVVQTIREDGRIAGWHASVRWADGYWYARGESPDFAVQSAMQARRDFYAAKKQGIPF